MKFILMKLNDVSVSGAQMNDLGTATVEKYLLIFVTILQTNIFLVFMWSVQCDLLVFILLLLTKI